MKNEPVAWGYISDDGGIYDCISPEEHDRAEGDYNIPLYTHPAKTLDRELLDKTIIDQQNEIKLLREQLRWALIAK